MKRFLLAIFLIFELAYKTLAYEICKTDLLYSYGVITPRYTNRTTLMCGGEEPESCCTHNDETKLSHEWSITNQFRIKPYISGYVYLMKKIFNYYEDLIVLAKYIYINPNSSEGCKDAAEDLVMRYIYKEEIVKFMDRLEIFMNNLASMRKGFYCTLCSVYNQRFFNTQTKKVIFSNDFCENLVEFSISEIQYKVKKVLPIFRRMNKILNCKDGIDAPEEIPIELSDEIVGQIDECYDSYSKNKDPSAYIHDCINYCKRFSLSAASEVYEGNLGRLEYVHNKIVSSGLISNDRIFPDLDMDVQYDFYKLNPEFFENKLSFEDFEKYENVFEPNGLEPFTRSTSSSYHYQLGKNPLKSIKSTFILYITTIGILGLFVFFN